MRLQLLLTRNENEKNRLLRSETGKRKLHQVRLTQAVRACGGRGSGPWRADAEHQHLAAPTRAPALASDANYYKPL